MQIVDILAKRVSDTKLAYESLGMMNAPSDPVERAKSAIAYKRAEQDYHAAREALEKFLEE